MTPSHGCKVLFSLSLICLSGCDTETSFRGEKADPVLVEHPVVYLQRATSLSADDETFTPEFPAREPHRVNPGAQLYFKANALSQTEAVNLTESLFEEGAQIDIRDLTVADDGQSFLVSIHAPEVDNDDEPQTTWNIWRYDRAVGKLERVISDDDTARQGDDLMPAFLPDGRIIFASTRQRLSRAILLDEGKPQYTALDERRDEPTFNIHIMEADGSSIEQISFNLSHDFYPLVQQNGKVIYSRWDAMGGDHGINLYQMNPDGTDNEIVYGWHSHLLEIDQQQISVDYVKPTQLPNGEMLMMLPAEDDRAYQKQPILINVTDFTDQNQTVANANTSGTAVSNLKLADFQFSFDTLLSPSGRLANLYPLPDDSQRYLISWDLCRVVFEEQILSCGQLTEQQLTAEDLQQAPAQYQLWLLDDAVGTQQLIAEADEGSVITEAVVMQPSDHPKAFIAAKQPGVELDATLAEQQAGMLHIRSVYDFDGIDATQSTANPLGITTLSDPTLVAAADLPARFLRIVRGVPMPPDEVRQLNGTDFGRSQNQLMREIVGYTPIQPDGSVKVKIPANLPIAISVVDADGQRIGGRHRQWISVKPGETLECIGCHTSNSQQPHGRFAAQADSINIGAIGGAPFPNASQTIIAAAGQTMAEAYQDTFGIAELSSGLNYQDRWTDAELSAVNPTVSVNYSNLETPAPNGSQCFDSWNAYCRVQINYVEHIQPLWELPRLVVDEATQELLADNTCTSCHGIIDADGLAQVPAGQLSLEGTPSSDQAAHLISYRELLFGDVEQEVIDGILVDRLVEVTDANGDVVFEVDADGNLILDEDGNPIPVLTTVGVAPILSTNGARASSRFFEVLNGAAHQGILSADEQKLISEWLDIGAQYYNTPFYVE